ncbi:MULTISPECIES: hypothetical protein [unclassified Massilia]|jgi:hypothetical protein|uniref:hypothetical protein n=1 Tax=unclassified Massilia TaxID=2609279 RepID=UPI00178396E0|nr:MULTISPECIES: hypothetical protein [unclassified Massilia]MBD8531633.1 hypothetical protein [Massilia sp. CFBP 13647]MBD8675078.1 hypothetical protein [Massilia sp. CFBP 13721]
MKKFLVTVVSAMSFAATLPAFAGPDWQIIEHGRKVKAERMRQEQARRAQENPKQSGSKTGKEQMMKECIEMMNKSKEQPEH